MSRGSHRSELRQASCSGPTRRQWLQAGLLGCCGLSLPQLLWAHQPAARPRSCIVLFLLGGPPQHETLDPKPDAPAEIRGDLKPIATNVPGIQVGELMPLSARQMNKICVLRGMATDSNAHASSGYEMLTGYPHPQGKQIDNLPITPQDWPSFGSVVKRLQGARAGLPAAVSLPQRIFNNGYIYWPGQNAGFLGRTYDPWLLECEPSADDYHVADLTLAPDISRDRIGERRHLLEQLNREQSGVAGPAIARFGTYAHQALDLLSSPQARRAFDLRQESSAVRDRYGRHKFGQSCLLARRLVEAGVRLVQVNWAREPSEISAGNPAWDTHQRNTERLKQVLMPPMDRAYSALLEDLHARGMLDDTLVVWMGEFGRTPRINPNAGRDHWGHVFSVALAGGGVRGGQVYGASDSIGGRPRDGRVGPHDLTATLFHCLGIDPHTEIHDPVGRPLAISRGEVIRQVL